MKLHNDHLLKAREYSNLPPNRWFYFKHLFWGLRFAFVLFTWSIAMFIHAFVPQLIGFTVLEKLVKFLKQMKRQHPEDPILKNVNFEEK